MKRILFLCFCLTSLVSANFAQSGESDSQSTDNRFVVSIDSFQFSLGSDITSVLEFLSDDYRKEVHDPYENYIWDGLDITVLKGQTAIASIVLTSEEFMTGTGVSVGMPRKEVVVNNGPPDWNESYSSPLSYFLPQEDAEIVHWLEIQLSDSIVSRISISTAR